jgi:hypothetical protein
MELYGWHHLRTVSSSNVGVLSTASEIFTSPELDFASFHTGTDDLLGTIGINPYTGIPFFSKIDPIRYISFIHKSAELARHKSALRPVFDTEDTSIFLNPIFVPPPFNLWFQGYSSEQLDDLFIGSAWAGLMGGGAGPGLRWPCTPYFLPSDPGGYRGFTNGMYDAQYALEEAISSIDLRGAVPVDAGEAVALEVPQTITSMVLSGPDAELVWLFNGQAAFARTEVTCSVKLTSLVSGLYHVRWYDLRTGAVLKEDWASGPQDTLQSPPFSIFVAATVKRK